MDLKKWLKDYDKIFLVDPGEKSWNLLSEMLRCVNCGDRHGRVLFLSTQDGLKGVQRISAEEYQSLWKLYHMYECSDRFKVLTDSRMYGSLLNYVDTGLLTMEEAAEALLR